MAEPIVNTLGIVGIKNRGAYDNSTNYEKLNVVTYEGSSYCAKGNTVGNLPTDTDYWDLLAQKGDTGPQGPQGIQGPKPVKGTDYYTDEDKEELEETLKNDVRSEVSDQLGTLTSATPLVASSISGMTDTTRVYVNTTDGKWYYYDGDSWEIGGTYQATEDSLTLELLDEHLQPFKVERLNLIDPDSWNDGKYIISNTGNAGTSGNYSITDYIFLEANTKYYIYGFSNAYYAFYDLNKTFLSNTGYMHKTSDSALNGYILADRDCYFRASVVFAVKPLSYISKYVDVPTSYDEYGLKYLPIYDLIKKRGLATGKYNLFNDCGYFSLSYAEGIPQYANNIITTDFIPIQGTLYYQIFNGKPADIQYIFEYDENKDFIKWISTGQVRRKVVLDEDTRYVRLRSEANSATYVLPSLDFYYQNLLVCDKEEYLEKYVPSENIIKADDVSYDFFKSSATFKRGFIKEALDNYIKTIEESSYDLVVPIITDLHTEQFESYSMLNYMASDGFADACFNLGDNIPEHYNTKEEAVSFMKNYMYVSNSKPRQSEIYVLRGNHDTNPVSGTKPTQVEATKMIDNALYYSLSGFRNKKGNINSNCNYGYVDTNAKIRLIFLDSSDIYDNNNNPITSGYNVAISQKQLDWFCNEALDFSDKKDKSEWSVVILSHAQLSVLGTGMPTILKAFMEGTTATGISTIAGITEEPLSFNYDVDFTEQGPIEFICAINGHLHEDSDNTIGETGRKRISVGCDSGTAYYYVNDTKTAYTRTKGTIEEHLMDTLCINKKTKTITMKRLGVGTDRTYSYE